MKKSITVMAILLLTAGFILAGQSRAEAMHTGSAVTFSGSITLFDQPVTRVVERRVVYDGEEYARAYPAHYRQGYPSGYFERTKIVIVKPGHRIHRHRGWDHRKGHHDEWCRHDHQGRRDDDRRDRRHDRWD